MRDSGLSAMRKFYLDVKNINATNSAAFCFYSDDGGMKLGLI